MGERLRGMVNRLLPWYDEERDDQESARVDETIRRSVHQRTRHWQLIQTALASTERRSHVRGDYQRYDDRIGQ
jgi:hypothetical protein